MPTSKIEQTMQGDDNQAIGQMSGGTAVGHVQGAVFNISDSTIANVTGTGNIYYQEVPHPLSSWEATQQPDQPTNIKTILVLAANPEGTSPLRLAEEVRSLQLGLERSRDRNRFRLEQRWATTVTDLRRALLDYQPQIVHFCGHGVGREMLDNESPSTRKVTVVTDANIEQEEGLVFEDEVGQPQLVSGAAIAALFALFSDQIECVVLNACYSAVQAKAIAQHIPYVVGMKRAISDKAAIEFAVAFYDALLAAREVEFAYRLGCSAIQMAGIPEYLTPILEQKSI
ncbi:MAG: CHAT domain-containing protein [Thainema sp.]